MPDVTSVKHDGVAVVTIGNADQIYLNSRAGTALDLVVRELEEDNDVRVIVFTGGAPGVFIQHYSVHELVATAEHLQATRATFDEDSHPQGFSLDDAFLRVERMVKPSIAAINGNCMGGGFEFALCCDLRIVEDGPYRIGLPEVTVGLLPGGGGTQRLPRLIGMPRALEYMLLGRTFAPQPAFAAGLVNEVVPSGKALERALELAREMTTRSPRALAHIKRLTRAAHDKPLIEGLRLERNLFMDLLTTEEALTLMKAYLKTLDH